MLRIPVLLINVLGLCALFVAQGVLADSAADYAAAIAQLPEASYPEKTEIVHKLSDMQQPGVKTLLGAFLEGNLYSRTSDRKVFIVAEDGDKYKLQDAVTLQDAGSESQDDFEKIIANNQLRKELRIAIAQFDLNDTAASARLHAVKEMLRSLDEDNIALLRKRLDREHDTAVRAAIETGLAMADLDNSDPAKRLAAIHVLRGNMSAEVYNRLNDLIQQNSDGSFAEPNDEVRMAARKAVVGIERWRDAFGAGQTMMFGLSLGAVLVLSAIGLAITFGVMGVINMAHGELMMLGAYTTYVVQLLMPNHIGASIIVAIPAAFLVSGLAGVLIERGLVRFLYGRPLETLLATFGVSLILQQLVRDVFTANNRPVITPSWLAGSWQVNDYFAVTSNRLYIMLFTGLVFVALLMVLKRTTLGLNVRAVAQNRAMARAMGVRTEWVDAMTFGLGAGIAGIAGVALSQLTNVGPNLGQQYIVDSFMVVVFGGVGNLWGTLISGLSLGVINKLLEPYSGAVLAKIFVLIFLILFIQRRPRGLFPQKGRAAEG
ncbi:MAG TPA: urea ABC transporter permease subunit UrtB [Steroidobacteraceae bacterium]|nr:urea ABC transporter permease subunit UrtB [Steroidobacteraceae bacterium]